MRTFKATWKYPIFSRQGIAPLARLFSSDSNSSDVNQHNKHNSKYKIFQDEDSPIILDANENITHEKSLKTSPIQATEYLRVDNYERGVTGVFDIEELVDFLKKDNAQDIFVVKVSKELNYVDFLVVVTGRSRRHLLGLAEYIRSIFKRKKHSSDITPKIEGENSSEWIALDLGNIALHIMSVSAREKYDLESLWSVGSEYDSQLNSEDNDLLKLIKKHSILLDDLQPLPSG